MLFLDDPVTFENGVHFSGWSRAQSQDCIVATFFYPLGDMTWAEQVVISAKEMRAAYGLELDDLIDAEKRHALPEGRRISIALWLRDKCYHAEHQLIDRLRYEAEWDEDEKE